MPSQTVCQIAKDFVAHCMGKIFLNNFSPCFIALLLLWSGKGRGKTGKLGYLNLAVAQLFDVCSKINARISHTRQSSLSPTLTPYWTFPSVTLCVLRIIYFRVATSNTHVRVISTTLYIYQLMSLSLGVCVCVYVVVGLYPGKRENCNFMQKKMLHEILKIMWTIFDIFPDFSFLFFYVFRRWQRSNKSETTWEGKPRQG